MVAPFPLSPLRPGRRIGPSGWWALPAALSGLWPVRDHDAVHLRTVARLSTPMFADAVAALLRDAGFDASVDEVHEGHGWIDVTGHDGEGRVAVVRSGTLPAAPCLAAVVHGGAVPGGVMSYSPRTLTRALAAVQLRHPRSPAPPLP